MIKFKYWGPLQMFLLVVIITGVGLIATQKIWVPKLVDKILGNEVTENEKNVITADESSKTPEKIININNAGMAFAYPSMCNPTPSKNDGSYSFVGSVASYDLNCGIPGESIAFYTSASIKNYSDYLNSDECKKIPDGCNGGWVFLEGRDYEPDKQFINGIGPAQFKSDKLMVINGIKYLLTYNFPEGPLRYITFQGDTMIEFGLDQSREGSEQSFIKDFVFKSTL